MAAPQLQGRVEAFNELNELILFSWAFSSPALPRLHGLELWKTNHSIKPSTPKCSGLIAFVCFRHGFKCLPLLSLLPWVISSQLLLVQSLFSGSFWWSENFFVSLWPRCSQVNGHLSRFSIAVINTMTKGNSGRKGFISSQILQSTMKESHCRKNLKAGTGGWSSGMCWLLTLVYLSFSWHQSGLGPSISIISQENMPLQACPQVNMAGAFARLRFPPTRWPHLVPHWQKVNNIRRKYFDSYLWRSSVCWRTEGCSHHDTPGSRRNTWDKGWAIYNTQIPVPSDLLLLDPKGFM